MGDIQTNEQFKKWWIAVQPKVLATLRKYVRTVDIYDVIQETALAALLKARAAEFADFEHFRRWALVRARGLALDTLRLDRLAQLSEAELKNQASPDQSEESPALLELRRRIEQLPKQQKAVLLQPDDKPARETARLLGIKESSVRSLRRHAKRRLAAELQEWEDSHG